MLIPKLHMKLASHKYSISMISNRQSVAAKDAEKRSTKAIYYGAWEHRHHTHHMFQLIAF